MHTQRQRTRSSRQQQRIIPQRQLSQAQLRRYFSSQRVPLKRAAIALIFGVLLIIISFYAGSIVLVTGFVVAIISGIRLLLIATSQPRDEQFDRWLDRQATIM